ncbi:MAG: hypothetical protein ABIY70_06785 [Capsulimonas sp.]|uniref:hypothetical protein n=1 Tax=Capsulimonas sp. TaxID=2494211 RepID=UPI0032655060
MEIKEWVARDDGHEIILRRSPRSRTGYFMLALLLTATALSLSAYWRTAEAAGFGPVVTAATLALTVGASLCLGEALPLTLRLDLARRRFQLRSGLGLVGGRREGRFDKIHSLLVQESGKAAQGQVMLVLHPKRERWFLPTPPTRYEIARASSPADAAAFAQDLAQRMGIRFSGVQR